MEAPSAPGDDATDDRSAALHGPDAPVRLVWLERSHAAELQQIARDPRVAIPAGLPQPLPDTWAYDLVEQRIAARAAGRTYSAAILPAGSSGVLGICSVLDIRPTQGRGELAYLLAVDAWGRGHGRAAAARMVRFAFDVLELTSLCARVMAGNVAAARILAHCGFRPARYRALPEGHPRRDTAIAYELNAAAWRGQDQTWG